jgi:hypothetical protein
MMSFRFSKRANIHSCWWRSLHCARWVYESHLCRGFPWEARQSASVSSTKFCPLSTPREAAAAGTGTGRATSPCCATPTCRNLSVALPQNSEEISSSSAVPPRSPSAASAGLKTSTSPSSSLPFMPSSLSPCTTRAPIEFSNFESACSCFQDFTWADHFDSLRAFVRRIRSPAIVSRI